MGGNCSALLQLSTPPQAWKNSSYNQVISCSHFQISRTLINSISNMGIHTYIYVYMYICTYDTCAAYHAYLDSHLRKTFGVSWLQSSSILELGTLETILGETARKV